MARKSPEQYGKAPRYYRRDDRLVYAIIRQALSSKAQFYEASRYSADGKLALVCALDADPDKPEPPGHENAWRWMSVDETRQLLANDPNWQTEEDET